MRSLSKFILRLIGWKVVVQIEFPDKCVICVAPHTSNWDLLFGLIVYKSIGQKASFLIKKEWFFFPMNIFFKFLGGIPVDRSKKTSLTEQLAEEYAKRDKFQIAITPEATRKRNPDWKKGFYYIALEAKVPIVVSALDYKKKEAQFLKIIVPSGDVDNDISLIKDCYRDVTACHPDNFVI